MRKKNWKKLLILNIPYLFIALFATKVGQAVRLAPGTDFSGKALHMMEGVRDAFASPMPSFHPADMCIGICIAAAMRLAVYIKGKNAKKFRHNREYGSARWGTADDIAPYVDPAFENNIILTQTESLTMNNRPTDPRTARNKNVLIIGGSGSGKTRFWIKPNLMQIRRYSAIEELDEAVLNRLISRILIGEVRKVDGQKVQEVRIVYNFVGEIPEIAA